MPRKSIKSKKRRVTLTDAERHLLLTGSCTPPGGGRWPEGWPRPFHLVSPAGKAELLTLWHTYKDELLREWTGPGIPWAAREFRVG